MHNFMAKFQKILEICKQYTGNQANGKKSSRFEALSMS